MPRRTEAEWRQLIADHAQSGQSQAAFCAEHQLNAAYFSTRRRQLLDKPPEQAAATLPAHTKPKLPQQRFSEVTLPNPTIAGMGHSLELTGPTWRLRLPADVNRHWLASLLQGVADVSTT